MQTTTDRPAEPAGAILPQLATQHLEAQKARQRIQKLREIASSEIERLIAFLDETDGYTTHELEAAVDDDPCDDPNEDAEPSLGSVNPTIHGSQANWAMGGSAGLENEHDDCEPDDDAEQDNADKEPFLGWPESYSIASRCYLTQITGLTAQQAKAQGREWVRR